MPRKPKSQRLAFGNFVLMAEIFNSLVANRDKETLRRLLADEDDETLKLRRVAQDELEMICRLAAYFIDSFHDETKDAVRPLFKITEEQLTLYAAPGRNVHIWAAEFRTFLPLGMTNLYALRIFTFAELQEAVKKKVLHPGAKREALSAFLGEMRCRQIALQIKASACPVT